MRTSLIAPSILRDLRMLQLSTRRRELICGPTGDGAGMSIQPACARYRASREAAAIGALRAIAARKAPGRSEAFRADCRRPKITQREARSDLRTVQRNPDT
jgi:hypothetical protein